MSANGSVSKRHFACTDCGQVYTSFFHCVCPHCRSGVVNQTEVDDAERHSRLSYTHKVEPHKYRQRAAHMHPEYVFNGKSQGDVQDEYLNSSVIVDHLAFTVKISEFRHCTKSSPFSGVAFPAIPALPALTAKSSEDADAINEYRRNAYASYFQDCVIIFITKVLGFTVGSMTGSKFQFYEDSFNIYSKDGQEYCGKVGVGGNNDTIHFQISGVGCKHLFTNRTRAYVHHWLANILNVTLLTRIDLAFDDFDGIHTCEAVELAFLDDGFKRSRGISPKYKNGDEWHINADGEKVFSVEARNIGSRQSLVFWRIYNKALEQKIEKEGFSWYRSEVELKKASVDVLLDVDGYFCGLNNYAASLFSKDVSPKSVVHKAKKRIACDVLKACFWAKRQYGRLVNSLFELYGGDYERVVTSLMRDDGKLSFTPMHQKLVDSL